MKKNGFTLIELLVVISIIAMLLAILMPALGIVKKKAQSVVCGSNVAQLSKAWFLYCAENDGFVPGANNYTTPQGGNGQGSWVCMPQDEAGTGKSGGSTVEEKIWGIKRGTLYPYTENPKVYHCPGDARYKTDSLDTGRGGKGGYRSFSIVGGLNGETVAGTKLITKQTQILRPSGKMVYLEESDGRGYNINSWIVNITTSKDRWIDPISIWHKDSSSLGFADGHAENHKWVDKDTIRMSELQTPGLTDAGSVDLEYVQEHYPYIR